MTDSPKYAQPPAATHHAGPDGEEYPTREAAERACRGPWRRLLVWLFGETATPCLTRPPSQQGHSPPPVANVQKPDPPPKSPPLNHKTETVAGTVLYKGMGVEITFSIPNDGAKPLFARVILPGIVTFVEAPKEESGG